MQFDFFSPTKIVFGWGKLNKIDEYLPSNGKKAFVLTGKDQHRAARLFQILDEHEISTTAFSVVGEPLVGDVQEACEIARAFQADMVIAFGGGSVMDTGKAVAALLNNPGELMDYLEVVGRGLPLENPSLPFIAIPTTSGTGTEVTSNAVLGVPDQGVKVSMRSPHMLPMLALVDPQLTVDLPARQTAFAGLDALTQVMEAFVSVKASSLVDVFCREGMLCASRSLRKAYQDGNDQQARIDMSFTALLSGMALANAGLGAVHGFAGPLGGMINAPHGGICASLLPHVMEHNIRILEDQNPPSPYLKRYDEVARILTGDRSARRQHGVDWIKKLCRELEIPGLGELGFSLDSSDELIGKAKNSSSMKGNPIELNSKQMIKLLQDAF